MTYRFFGVENVAAKAVKTAANTGLGGAAQYGIEVAASFIPGSEIAQQAVINAGAGLVQGGLSLVGKKAENAAADKVAASRRANTTSYDPLVGESNDHNSVADIDDLALAQPAKTASRSTANQVATDAQQVYTVAATKAIVNIALAVTLPGGLAFTLGRIAVASFVSSALGETLTAKEQIEDGRDNVPKRPSK